MFQRINNPHKFRVKRFGNGDAGHVTGLEVHETRQCRLLLIGLQLVAPAHEAPLEEARQ